MGLWSGVRGILLGYAKPRKVTAAWNKSVQNSPLTGKIESPARHNQAGLKHSLFCLVNLSKPYLLLAFQEARFIKGEMSILGLAPPCPRSVGNQSGHSSKWHFVIISASAKPIWDMIYVDKGLREQMHKAIKRWAKTKGALKERSILNWIKEGLYLQIDME